MTGSSFDGNLVEILQILISVRAVLVVQLDEQLRNVNGSENVKKEN